ncbi:MAG: GMC family oxidoreductase [Acidobacteria bacterium]|nr:GMC family oxidoreductase [Acidobacteriota bacterium]
MTNLAAVDVVIIGGGWSGMLMAKELAAKSSSRIVVLERGKPRNPKEYIEGMDELDYALRYRMMQDVAKETVTFRNEVKQKALPIRQFGSFLPGDGVGGAGEHWNGMTPRFLPDVFEMHKTTVEKYGKKRLPAGSTVQDWGITYKEIEPYYLKAEQLLGISGLAGNPMTGPRSGPFPTPPLKQTYFGKLFTDASLALGYHPYPAPSANLSQSYRNPDGVIRPACQYCGFCERFGCMVGAKAQPTNTLLPVLQKRSNVTITTSAQVRRIVTKDGVATGVVYVSNGKEFFQPAARVVLASWTLNNTRLLLLSGIGNANTGRNLTHQVMGAGATLFFDRPLNRYMGSGSSNMTVSDFDGDNFDHSQVDFIRGAYISSPAYGARPIANFGAVPGDVKATWGSEWKKAAVAAYDRTARLGSSGEHIPYSSNFMDLDPTYTDILGDPLLRLTLDWNENEMKIHNFISSKIETIAKRMPVKSYTMSPALKRYDVMSYKSTHLQGGTIMGSDPSSSVVDPRGRHWQVRNLWVLGASTFPQNPSGNPTLTVLAQTLMAASAWPDR